MTESAARKSDLGVRVVSAVVMIAVAGTALWLGGLAWTLFVIAVALGALWEWRGLVRNFLRRSLWMGAGILYIGMAAILLWTLRTGEGIEAAATIIAAVVAVDVGAYLAGRTIGGPKIAPAISPSKTWAGLFGGMAGAGMVLVAAATYQRSQIEAQLRPFNADVFAEQVAPNPLLAIFGGMLIGIVAQSGDFLESWMKRRAGVKDSGTLIPGHGGLLDRVDGLLAVCFVIAMAALATVGTTLLSGGSLLPSPA